MPRRSKTRALRDHNHRHCLDKALSDADRVCQERGLRLTPVRRRVLELVWRKHSVTKAYGLLAELEKELDSAAPPTVYRALDFLLEAGLIHRIESLNAFVGCPEPGKTHPGQFMICQRCENVEELDLPAVAKELQQKASGRGFVVERQTVEVRGLCAACTAH